MSGLKMELSVSDLEPPHSVVGNRKWNILRQQSAALSERGHGLVRDIVASPTFDVVIGLIIIVNSVIIGVEQSFRIHEMDTMPFQVLEIGFLTFYVLELVFRLVSARCSCLRDHWVQFDTILVTFGVIDAVVAVSHPETASQVLGDFGVLRVARLVRLMRTVRVVRQFRPLYLLVQGLQESFSTVLCTLVIVTTILYVFACLGIELITMHPLATENAEFMEVVDAHFRTLPITMLTLVQFINLDSINLVYRPLVFLEPFLCLYFVAVMLLLPVVLMNLVTAVLVNAALETAAKDKDMSRMNEEHEKQKLVRELVKVFRRADADGSGHVSIDEILELSQTDLGILCELTSMTDPAEIFSALDGDDSGLVDLDEFCQGLWEIVMSKAPVELRRTAKRVDNLQKMMGKQREDMVKMLASQTAVVDICTRLLYLHDVMKSPTGTEGAGWEEMAEEARTTLHMLEQEAQPFLLQEVQASIREAAWIKTP
eukprot:TRINITY_DN45226_c0_g1_i1.p1 TRINITY_DN45226_c0_g1~~TRINITY_DN45226_c0_g1_i1.p1  ORF type:complete len:484 (+),score=100.64 TRINITY_DN45226_c0_g1_i1:266-1717(+)